MSALNSPEDSGGKVRRKRDRQFWVMLGALSLCACAAILLCVAYAPWTQPSLGATQVEKPIHQDGSLPIKFVPGDIIVQWKKGLTRSQKEIIRAKYAIAPRTRYTVSMPSPNDSATADFEVDVLDALQNSETASKKLEQLQLRTIEQLSNEPEVEFAQPNYLYEPATLPASNETRSIAPNDFYYVKGTEWGVSSPPVKQKIASGHSNANAGRPRTGTRMRESSQSSVRSPKIEKPNRSSLNVIKPQSTADKDPTAKTIRSDYGIRADKAWANNHFSDPDTFIGIVDTGIQFSHRDLKGNIWNGIGKDFYSFSPIPITTWDPVDDAHGTHVAGIIAAVGNNGKGIVGVAWRAKLIIAKFMGPNHWATTEAAVGAIDYLTDLKENHGFHIVAINLSWVGAGQDKALLRAIKHAGRDEILCVVAAGNYHLNNDKDLVYPANFDTSRDNIDNTGRLAFNSIISVAAIKPDGTLADFSDYGRSTVHIAAPGMDIVSTWPNDTYRLDSGTSSSAAFVSGAIALYASSHPGAGARDIRKAILDTATPVAALKGLVATGGTLNVSTF